MSFLNSSSTCLPQSTLDRFYGYPESNHILFNWKSIIKPVIFIKSLFKYKIKCCKNLFIIKDINET